jgi:hypothetical protein
MTGAPGREIEAANDESGPARARHPRRCRSGRPSTAAPIRPKPPAAQTGPHARGAPASPPPLSSSVRRRPGQTPASEGAGAASSRSACRRGDAPRRARCPLRGRGRESRATGRRRSAAPAQLGAPRSVRPRRTRSRHRQALRPQRGRPSTSTPTGRHAGATMDSAASLAPHRQPATVSDRPISPRGAQSSFRGAPPPAIRPACPTSALSTPRRH